MHKAISMQSHRAMKPSTERRDNRQKKKWTKALIRKPNRTKLIEDKTKLKQDKTAAQPMLATKTPMLATKTPIFATKTGPCNLEKQNTKQSKPNVTKHCCHE